MKNLRIGVQVSLGFAVMLLLVLASAIMIWVEAQQSEDRARGARRSTTGAVALADAQSTLWQLRYGFPQFMVGDEAARRKIVQDEPNHYAVIEKSLEAYAASTPSDEEKKALKALRDVYTKYIAARPKWFDLYGSGKLDEAKEWRAATTTPFGAGTVQAFSELIDLQQKVSLQSHEEGVQELRQMRHLMLGMVVVALIGAVLLASAIVRGLLGQLGGEPAYAKEVAARIAAGDLASDVEVRRGDTTSVVWAMKKMRDNLRAVVVEVAANARVVADTSGQIAQGNADLSQRTEEQASTLEETASSMEELTSTVAQNADNARQASQLAVDASEVARKGGDVVGQVVTTMTGISESSKKIADIISVIDGIAFQTNILALNAAVEAARAGEQGRGFAVVAAEVRNLAQRSAAAAKEIKSLIGDSVEKVDAGARLVDAAGKTMEEIVVSVKRVSDLIAEIAAAGREQSSGIGQVNAAVTQMERVVQQNATLVEEAAAATESLRGQAGSLLSTMDGFQLGTGAREGIPGAVATPSPEERRPLRGTSSSPVRLAAALVPAFSGGLHRAKPVPTGANAAWKEF